MVWHVCAPAYSCKPKRSADAPRMFENNLQTIRKILGTNFVDDLLHYKKKTLGRKPVTNRYQWSKIRRVKRTKNDAQYTSPVGTQYGRVFCTSLLTAQYVKPYMWNDKVYTLYVYYCRRSPYLVSPLGFFIFIIITNLIGG